MAPRTVSVHPSAEGTGAASYLTLAAAIAGELIANADIATAEMVLTIEIQGDWSGGADTTAVVVNGFTTSAAYYIQIITDGDNRPAASGWDTNSYCLETTNAAPLNITDNHVRVDGLQIGAIMNTGSAALSLLRFGSISGAAVGYATNCRIRRTGNNSVPYSKGITGADAEFVLTIWNCIVENHSDDSGTSLGFETVGILNVYNCVAYNCDTGFIERESATFNIYNSAVFASATADFTGDHTGKPAVISHCASDANDTTDATNIAESGGGADWPDDFTASATGDFTLLTGSNLAANSVGVDESGIFTVDIDGTTRVNWHIGAYEFSRVGTDWTTHTHSTIVFS